MYNHHTGTPCPPPLAATRGFASSAFGESKQKQTNIFEDALDHFNDNTTQNIARFVQQEFRNAPPLKTQGLAQKPKRNAPVRVFPDGNSCSELSRRGESARPLRGSAINSRPAQKIRTQKARDVQLPAFSTSSMDISQVKLENASGSALVDSEDIEKASDRAGNSRRRTIWIPSEDTTIMSIHPGAYTHTLSDETIGFPAKDVDRARMVNRKGLGKRSCNSRTTNVMNSAQKSESVPPKRSALRTLAPSQSNALSRDVLGSGGGKENIPPGTLLSRFGEGEKPVVKPLGSEQSIPQQPSIFMQPTAATQAKTTNIKKRSASEIKDAPRAKVPVTKDPRPKARTIRKEADKPAITTSDVQTSHRAPSKLSMPVVAPNPSAQASRYPVLSNDLCQPELYEENWLQHQEVAMTELVNGVFQQAGQYSIIPRDLVANLRGKLINLYHTPAVATLHKRLKASLMYGALGMPKDSPSAPRVREDVGLRRQFIDLFVQSYDLDILQAAAEAVVGRAMAVHLRASSISHSEDGDALATTKIKELRLFLLTFFIRHEDSTELLSAHKLKSSENLALQAGTAEWFWLRTVLRGFMLIHLLDQAKITGSIAGCLFQTSSTHKSSASVLQGFAKLMTPSVGDVTRPLRHLEYDVSQVQQPLEEYKYRIDNLAVDLRNGVLLTRFVELLLYPPTSPNTLDDCTVTLAFPDGETLTSILKDDRTDSTVLTQHLKFPCVGRVQKLHNVQIALSALTGVRGLTGTAIENIKAEDIVDGHREKTLSLLWSLVSKWGLGMLVDWEELQKETRRFSGTAVPSFDFETGATGMISGIQPDPNEQAGLLKSWAASVCQQHNVSVTNLTTSFANGQALSAIISTYADYVPMVRSRAQQNRPRLYASTAERLHNLGCSESFIALFASQATRIPSRSSTISLLAFLASRLLPLARAHRAASAIQRAYRLRLARQTISLRVQQMKAAVECALVAETKQKELEATVVLQRAWRGVLDRRIGNMERDVLAFQNLARGWAVRDALRGALGGIGGRRVMGGW